MNISGTSFFFRKKEGLFRAVSIQLPDPFSGDARVEICAGSEQYSFAQVFTEGQAVVPAVKIFDRPLVVQVTVTCPQATWSSQVCLPPTRPWTIYIAQDKHLDFGWIHPVEGVLERIKDLLDIHQDGFVRLDIPARGLAAIRFA